MLRIKILLVPFLLLGLAPLFLKAQLQQKPTWETKTSKSEVKIGEEIELIFTSKIQKDWYMYSSDFSESVGPTVARFDFEKHPSYQLVGKLRPVGNHKHFDEVFEGEVSTFTGKAEFRQKVKILKANPVIKVALEFQECSQITGMCVLFDDEIVIKNIKVLDDKGATTATTTKEPAIDSASVKVISQPIDTAPKAAVQSNEKVSTHTGSVSGGDQKSMLAFLIFAFLGGVVAVVTPCVFPMLPMTVTFFTKRSETRSIVGIYASLGVIFGVFGLGEDFGNALSTHWLPNILFFVIFIVFAASFLGMFEITLPHQFVNQVDSKSSMGSFIGVFFMAFTLVLVSFSCTGPIVGSLLIEAVGGQFLKPALGMAAFGAGLAAPFTLFAIFPSWLQNLPKSGGWLNSVKVVLGFLELALAFKFLSIPDQTYHWGLLDREIYIAIWIVVFFLLGLYLLGKLRFAHDDEVTSISVPRLFLAIATFTFVLSLFPGLFGAPLKAISGYLPPQETLDFDLSKRSSHTSQKSSDFPEKVRFDDVFKPLPHELNGFYDYKEALAYSKKVNKPIFIDFTGHGCVNCREMEANVWSDPAVLKRLQEDFVVLALYVDDKTELPQEEWYVSTRDNKEKKTIGKQNADLQISKYNANAQPYYVIINQNEKTLVEPKAYDLNVQNFVNFLDAGKAAFNTK